ncbi:hypothetical protein [Cellulosimicrobium arenosum]|uniref:Uncharacterized protein n=1 Tax=Cellulosimicrobium arenosum TaxID=2708133 RepID=A0A927G9G9_9MICO|nr:hypothetical protein [Cellulosimicrobium arenosum]MBD8078912.1 hypothetical protein [Cellulosimicrobium arenosum]
MRLCWGARGDDYVAQTIYGTYSVVRRGDEWCLVKPEVMAGRIGGFGSPAEAMALGEDLHAARIGPQVRTPPSGWPTVDEFAREIHANAADVRVWLRVHASGSTSPRRRLDPTTRERIRSFWLIDTVLRDS